MKGTGNRMIEQKLAGRAEYPFRRACVATNWKVLGRRFRSALAPADVVVTTRLADLITCSDCDVYVIDTKVPDMHLWPAPLLVDPNPQARLWLFLASGPGDLRRLSQLPGNSAVFERGLGAPDELVEFLAARADREAGRRFVSVDYLENLRSFLTRMENGNAYVLKLDVLPEADGSRVIGCRLGRGRRYFMVNQESGNWFEVPWDDVLYHCEPTYRFYKGRELGEGDEGRAKRIGERVRTVRRERGLTISQLAEQTGMKRPNLSRLEHGRHDPSLETLDRVAQALGVPVAQLVARK